MRWVQPKIETCRYCISLLLSERVWDRCLPVQFRARKSLLEEHILPQLNQLADADKQEQDCSDYFWHSDAPAPSRYVF